MIYETRDVRAVSAKATKADKISFASFIKALRRAGLIRLFPPTALSKTMARQRVNRKSKT
jgi:hypothetical protein